MTNNRKKSGNAEDLILGLWEECQSEFAGESELTQIQKTLFDTLGIVESPARIARTLANHHVRLRHPEILDADSKWREKQLNKGPDLRELNFETIENAISSMKRLEELRARFVSEGDERALQIVVEQARELKLELARKRTELAKELIQWLAIWLQNPEIFEDWSDLRRNSPEFRQRFSSGS
jgi:hypothetical protein